MTWTAWTEKRTGNVSFAEADSIDQGNTF